MVEVAVPIQRYIRGIGKPLQTTSLRQMAARILQDFRAALTRVINDYACKNSFAGKKR